MLILVACTFNVHVTVSPLEHLNVTGAMGPGPQNAVHGGSHLQAAGGD